MSLRARDEAQAVLGHLAEFVGPRRPSSPEEASAAAYLNARLRRAGLRVDTRELRAPAFRGAAYAPLAALAALAALVGPLLPLPSLLMVAWLLLALIADSLIAPLPGPLRRLPSQDIIANREVDSGESDRPRGPRWRVLLLAPLDTPVERRGLARLAGPTRGPTLARLFLAALAATPAGLALAGRPAGILWAAATLFALAQLPLLVAAVTPPAPAASDGGSGALAALVAAVTRLGGLARVELWAVGVGAASADQAGIELLARRFPFPPGETLALSIQRLDRGQLVYVTREGALLARPAAPRLLQLAAAADAADTTIDAEPRPYLADDTLLAPLRRAGIAGLTLLSRPDPSAPPASVDPALIERAARLIVGIVRGLDNEG